MLRNFTKLSIPVIIFSLLLPFFPLNAASPSYNYRHTKMGSGTRQTGQWEYEITDEKYDFSTDESVFALTRIFNITNVNNFQFKYEIRGAENRDMLSPVYKPNKSWWAEIWYWDEFGKLPSGNYALGVFVSLDNGTFKKLDSKRFTVSGENIYDHTYEYDNLVTDNKCQNSSYRFDGVETGKNINSLGSFAYEIVDKTDGFRSNENVFVMVKNSQIKGVDSFRIKFDVYLDGKYFHKTNEPGLLNPHCNLWKYNYTWGNLGNLPTGTHEIRTYIKINNGAYRLLNTKKISVNVPVKTVVQETKQPVKQSISFVNNYNFDYSWTQTDNIIRFDGNYIYSTIKPRTEFNSYEDIRVLTKLSNISNINSFRIRHELHKDGKLVDKTESASQNPGSNSWVYNYTESNFGKLIAGDYEIRVFISINNEAWRFLDSKLITVSGSIVENVGYQWTQIGGNKDFYNYGYYNLTYPSYVTFPFSLSQL